MKKYFEIARLTWKSMLAYRYDVFSGALFSVCKILLACLMWSIIFKSRDQVGGYDFSSMITYYIIASLFGRLDQSNGLNWQFSGEIKNGQFGKYLVRPLRPVLYFAACCYSKSLYVFSINLVAAVAWALIFAGRFSISANIMDICLSILIFLLGLNFMILFNYFLSILSFKFINIDSLNVLKGNFIEFVSGALIPLTVFPAVVTKVFSLLPFYYTVYYPTALFLDKNVENPVTAIAVMIFWNAAMIVAAGMYYGNAVKKFEGVGI
jgi:ABC-2 type transport system permease protein